jgi:hypothetical protein
MAKVGRPKKIKTPEELFQAFQRYEIWVKDNPFLVHDFKGSGVEEVYIKKERPLSMEGFSNFCFRHKIHSWIDDYFHNKENRYTEFATICKHIKHLIRENQVSGGMAGVFNASLTQRLNNITEKQEIETTIIEKKQIFKIGDQEIQFD